MIETSPSSLRRWIRSRISAPSFAPMAASGSSSRRISASECTVRATAIACRWPPDRRATGALRLGMLMPISSSDSRASLRIARLARNGSGFRTYSRRRNMFWNTASSSISARS